MSAVEVVDMPTCPSQDGSSEASSEKPLPDELLPCSKVARICQVAVFGSLGAVLFGLDIGYLGPMIFSDSFKHDVAHTDQGMIDGSMIGLYGTIMTAGAAAASFPLVSAILLDRLGARWVLMLSGLLFIVGAFVQGTSNGDLQFLAGRFVTGVSMGFSMCTIVPYQSEMAPRWLRGALGTLMQLGICFGSVCASFIDQLLVPTDAGWRKVMAVISIPAAALVLGMIWMPNSPRWLVQKGRRKEALEVLRSMRSEADAIQEEAEIHAEVNRTQDEAEAPWAELFRGRTARLLIVGASLQMVQQLSGIMAVCLKGPQIFSMLGVEEAKFFTGYSLLAFFTTFIAVFGSDRIGRRTLLIASAMGITLSMAVIFVLGVMFVTKVPETQNKYGMAIENKAIGWVIGANVLLYCFHFAYGFGPIVWAYVSEIFPLRHRARCYCICTLSNFFWTTSIGQVTPMLLEAMDFWVFLLFGSFCFIGLLFCFYLPETKGVPLEHVPQLFDKKWGFRNTAQAAASRNEAQKWSQ